jgi:hypothetical protein
VLSINKENIKGISHADTELRGEKIDRIGDCLPKKRKERVGNVITKSTKNGY